MIQQTDEECLSAFIDRGDDPSFAILVDRYSGQALGVARNLLRDEHAAQDAVQDTFVRVVDNRHRFDRDHRFAPWFFTILRNICLDVLRRRKRHLAALPLLSFFLDDGDHGPVSSPVSLGILMKLEEKEREVLYYRIVCDLSFEEVATIAGCSVEAAKKRAQRGVAQLRERMGKGW